MCLPGAPSPPQLASLAFGERDPTSVLASGHLNQHGVDKTAALTLTYEGGGVASLCCSIGCEMPNEALICGALHAVTCRYMLLRDAQRGPHLR